jgi:hypothetical protein
VAAGGSSSGAPAAGEADAAAAAAGTRRHRRSVTRLSSDRIPATPRSGKHSTRLASLGHRSCLSGNSRSR